MNRCIQNVSRVVVTLPLVMLLGVGHAASKSVTNIEQDLLRVVELLDDKRVDAQFPPSLKKDLSKSVKEIAWANQSAKSNTASKNALNDFSQSELQSLLKDSPKKTSAKSLKKVKASSKKRSRYLPCYKYGYTQLQSKSKKYQRSITEASRKHGVNENLIKSVITAESCFKIRARSHKGARGLMQLMPATARRFGVKNSYSSHQNIGAGTRYLRWLLDRYKGNMHFALAGYNAGEGKVDRYGGIPPYKETREYVRRVMGVYKTLHGKKEVSEYGSTASAKKPNALQKTRAEYHRIWQQQQARKKTASKNTRPINERRCVEAVPNHLTYQTRLKRSGHGGRIWRRYYNLQAGENLSHVMKKTGVHINTIKRMNHLTSKSTVLAGHQLLVWECRA